MKEWLFVELNFVPETLHGIGSSMKQTEISNDNTRKTDNVEKTTVIDVVRIIVIILCPINIIIVNYKMSKHAKSGHGPHLFRIFMCVVLVIVLCYCLYAVMLLLCCTVIVLLCYYLCHPMY